MPSSRAQALFSGVCSLFVLACGHSGSPAPESPAPTVASAPEALPASPASAPATSAGSNANGQVRFAWPAGIVARVAEVERQESDDDSTVISHNYVRRTEAASQGVRVIDDQITVGPETSDDTMRAMLEGFAGSQVQTLVSARGEFLSAEAPNVQDRLRAALAKAGMPEELVEGIAQAASPEALAEAARVDWDDLVGTWLKLVQRGSGTQGEGTLTPSVPGMESSSLRTQDTFEIGPEVPCSEAQPALRCVELKSASSLDPASTAQALETVNGKTGKQQIKYESLTYTKRATLLAEVDTLLPHRFNTVTETVVQASVRGKPRQHRERNDTQIAYTYERRP